MSVSLIEFSWCIPVLRISKYLWVTPGKDKCDVKAAEVSSAHGRTLTWTHADITQHYCSSSRGAAGRTGHKGKESKTVCPNVSHYTSQSPSKEADPWTLISDSALICLQLLIYFFSAGMCWLHMLFKTCRDIYRGKILTHVNSCEQQEF